MTCCMRHRPSLRGMVASSSVHECSRRLGGSRSIASSSGTPSLVYIGVVFDGGLPTDINADAPYLLAHQSFIGGEQQAVAFR